MAAPRDGPKRVLRAPPYVHGVLCSNPAGAPDDPVCSPVPNVSQQPHGWASPQLGGTLALPVDSRALSILLTAVARSSSFGVRGAHLYEGFFRVHLRLFHVKQPLMCPFCRESVACGRQVGTYSTRIQRFM